MIINKFGKFYEVAKAITSPFSEGIKYLGEKGVGKFLGKVGSVVTYAKLGVTFVSSGIDEYNKTGDLGKAVIGGTIETVKSIGPLEGMTIGAGVGGPLGAVVGGGLGLVNVGVQFLFPDAYDTLKDGAYDLYDKGKELIGNAVSQSVETVKSVCEGVKDFGNDIVNAVSSFKLPDFSFGW